MFSKTTLATIVATSLLSTPAFAATETDNTIIVTATRTAQTADETLASVSIISRDDIKKKQANSLHELLAGEIGINTTNMGGFGKANTLSLRGTNASHTLVLVDGVRIGSATNGSVPLQDININQVERIEIVRGPLSSLYGSDAIGGVINIITTGQANGIIANLGSGTYNTRKAGVNGSFGDEKLLTSVGINHFSTEGFNAKENSNPDNDGYFNRSAHLSLKSKLSNALSMHFSANQSVGNNEYDGYFITKHYETDFKEQVINAGVVASINDSWDSKLTISENRDENTNRSDGAIDSIFNTKRYSASWQNDIIIDDNSVATLGLDAQQDKIASDTDYSKTSRKNRALFAQYQMALTGISAQASLRRDNNETFGGKNTGNISLGFPLSTQSELRISYGSAFRAPTFNDLYFPASATSAGNSELLPEESNSFEISFSQGDKQANYELNIFRTKVKNLIDWACTSGDIICNDGNWMNDLWQPSNVNSAMIRGIEFSLNSSIKNWQMGYDVTLLNARDEETNKYLARRADHTSRLHLTSNNGKLTTNIDILAQSNRYDDKNNLNSLAGYTVVNLAFNYQVTAPLGVKFEVANLRDRDYQTAKGYNNGGRTLFISADYKM